MEQMLHSFAYETSVSFVCGDFEVFFFQCVICVICLQVVDDDAYDSGGQGHHDSGESYAAAPDLDHTQKQVQDELTDWMNWLRAEIAFDGWRFDYAKGYAPEFCGL
jgi:hypothetical protein